MDHQTQELPLRPSTPLNDFYITLPQLPSSAEVQEYAEKHPRSHEEAPKLPLWALVCLWGGVALLLGFALLAVTLTYLVLKEGAFL